LAIFDFYSGVLTAGFIGLMAHLLSCEQHFDKRAECEMLQLEVFASHVEYLHAFSCTQLLQPNLQYECKLQTTLVVFSEYQLRFISESTQGVIWYWSFKWNMHKQFHFLYYK
jgi:hypothetical protein